MSDPLPTTHSRRAFLSTTGSVAAASVLAGVAVPRVHAAEDNTIRVALIGCGGRGSGAARDAMSVQGGPVKLVAMADVFEARLNKSYGQMAANFADKLDVPEERRFIGFDGYRKAMDCLRPGDIAILGTPPGFRWVHFGYAIEKKLNVFMEKPLTCDGPTSRRMLEMGQAAQAQNLKVGVGLMSRHSRDLQQLHQQVQDGALGEIITMRGYRMTPPMGRSRKWLGPPEDPSELLWQIARFHCFIWASGGAYNDALIHIIDHCCWLKNAWPVKAQALGGRHYRVDRYGNPSIDQNFDVYAVEYTFDDGSKFFFDGRFMAGTEGIYSSYLHGTKGLAVASKSGDCGAPSSIHKDQTTSRASQIWQSSAPKDETNPYQNEWNDLVDAIRNDKPYNEVEYGVKASLTSSMGRKAAHTGVEITFEDMLNSNDEYAPGLDKLTMDSPAPLAHDAEGKYPIPQPGLVTNREY